MLQEGDIAPDFRIGEGSFYHILAQRSAVVFFFPKAFTPGWRKEAGEFRRLYDDFVSSGFEVIGVSPDTQDRNDQFRKSLDLPYPLVGDPDGTIVTS